MASNSPSSASFSAGVRLRNNAHARPWALYAGKEYIMLPVFRIDDIRNFRPRPCYDPSRYLAEDWTGTALDVLDVTDCPAADRIWVVLGMMSENDRRLAACCFVRRTPIGDGRTVWDLLTDDRSRKAVEVAERFADGEATERELDAARGAARDAQIDILREMLTA